MSLKYPGVTFYEADRQNGPFKIRIGGTSEFVSDIDPHFSRSWPPGKVEVTKGWDSEQILQFKTMDDALAAASQVWNIEGFHVSIEAEPSRVDCRCKSLAIHRNKQED